MNTFKLNLLLIFIIFINFSSSKKLSEQEIINGNLKMIRKDFNELIEKMENVLGDVVNHIQASGKLLGTFYDNGEDYEWNDNKIEKTTKKIDKIDENLYDLRENEIETRRKRAVTESNNEKIINPIIKSSNIEETSQICPPVLVPDIQKEQLGELKKEVLKLSELVSVLKLQQKMIKHEDENNDMFNKKDFLEEDNNNNQNRKFSDELNAIKNELKKTQNNLIQTKELLGNGKQKEDLMIEALKRQNNELKFLKMMMEHLYDKTKRLNSFKNNNDDLDSILGTSNEPSLPYLLQNDKKFAKDPEEFKQIGLAKKDKNSAILLEAFPQQFKNKIENPLTTSSRKSNSAEDADLKIKLMELLLNEKINSHKEETFKNSLVKLLKTDENDVEEKTNKNSELNILELLKNLNAKPQIKLNDDEDFEMANQFKQLQKAIRNLAPKENKNFNNFELENHRRGEEKAEEEFATMLNQIISQNNNNNNNNNANSFRPHPGYSGIPPYFYSNFNLHPYGNLPAGYFGNYPQFPQNYPPLTFQNSKYPNQPINNPNNFFPYPETDQEFIYGSSNNKEPNLDQSFANNPQISTKTNIIIKDLTQQTENLENIIKSLKENVNYNSNNNNYDKSAVDALQQRIYELKGVLNSLTSNTPISSNSPLLVDLFNKNDAVQPSEIPPQPKMAMEEYFNGNLNRIRRNTQSEEYKRSLNNLKYQLGVPKNHLGYLNQENNNFGIFPINKHSDAFTEILIKILEKLFNALPEVATKLFGNYFNEIGSSYGDYESSLQNILRNLGSVGYFPLIFAKLMESSGLILQQLKSNKLFKNFLLPGIVLGLVGGVVLFLIYFYQQQDEPYGYISYENNLNLKYPRYYYEPNNNNNNIYDNNYYRSRRNFINKNGNYLN